MGNSYSDYWKDNLCSAQLHSSKVTKFLVPLSDEVCAVVIARNLGWSSLRTFWLLDTGHCLEYLTLR